LGKEGGPGTEEGREKGLGMGEEKGGRGS